MNGYYRTVEEKGIDNETRTLPSKPFTSSDDLESRQEQKKGLKYMPNDVKFEVGIRSRRSVNMKVSPQWLARFVHVVC